MLFFESLEFMALSQFAHLEAFPAASTRPLAFVCSYVRDPSPTFFVVLWLALVPRKPVPCCPSFYSLRMNLPRLHPTLKFWFCIEVNAKGRGWTPSLSENPGKLLDS